MEEETEQQQSKNFYRLVTLLIDIGGEALRDVLLKEIPLNQLGNVIQNNITLLSRLKNMKVLTEPQFDLLQEIQPNPTKFDISLLVALLRNLCPGIEPPDPDWKVAVPDSDDFSMGAELVRIKNIRNTKMHVSTTLMPKSTFQPLWTELAAIIHRIAFKVSSECGLRISRKVVLLEGADINPLGEKERQLLNTLKDWQTQIIDIINEKVNSLQSSLESLHLKNDKGLDAVDAIRETGDANSKKLKSLDDRVSQIAEDVSIISQDVSSMSNQAQGGGDNVPAQRSDITHIKEQLQFLRQELASMKQQIHHLTERSEIGPQNIPRSYTQSHGGGNFGDISDREIDSIAHKIGLDWERIGTFLDYESNQIDDLKHIYRDQPVTRNSRMIKRWAEVVVSCGESPRTLLAAAFASIQNIEIAQSLIPAEQVEEIRDQEARQETKNKIKLINFDIQGKGSSSRKSPVMAIGGEGGINVFDGEVTLGSLSIHPSSGSSIQDLPDASSLPSGSSIQTGGTGSLNIFGGTVKSDNIQIGQPSLFNRTSNICRGEGFDVTDGAGKSSDSKKMRTIGNTLSSNTGRPDFFFPRVRSSNQSSSSLPGCFLQIADSRVLVQDQHNLLDVSKSVGKLCSRNGFGTCFRVGHNYVMTARHVVMDIVNNGMISLGRGPPTPFAALDNEDVYVNFDFLSSNTMTIRKFYLTSNVVFDDEELDIAVVELKPAQQPFPLPFPNFAQAQPNSKFTFVGHPFGEPKQLNQVEGLEAVSPETKEEAVAWSREVAGIDGFAGIDTPGRILFHCSFQKGGSGSPGIAMVGQQAVVVTVLLHGYPEWVYDPNFSQEIKNRVENKQRIEQGVSMMDLYLKMHAVNSDLCYAIFGRPNE